MPLKTFLFKFSFAYNLIPVKFLMNLSGKKVIFPFYHYVEDSNIKNEITSNLYKAKNKVEFIEDLNFLKKNFKSISIKDLVNKKTSKNNFSFLLSFDDGLSNFLDVVTPILIQEKISAINFLNTNFIDNKELFYRYKANILIDFFKNKELTNEQIKEVCKSLNFKDFEKREIIRHIKEFGYADILLIDKLCNILNFDVNDFLSLNKPYLTKNQIGVLSQKGFYFGAHSKSHPYYAEINYEAQIQETAESIDYLKEEFNFKNVPFAFPFSDDNVSLDFFNLIKIKKQLTFGTAGIKDEHEGIDNIQRIPMEYKNSKYTAETIIKGELILYIMKKIVGKHLVSRYSINKK